MKSDGGLQTHAFSFISGNVLGIPVRCCCRCCCCSGPMQMHRKPHSKSLNQYGRQLPTFV